MDVRHAVHVVSASDAGLVRTLNEDAVGSDLAHGLIVLADGMGGYQSGEVASEVAVLVVISEFAECLDLQQLAAGGMAALSVPEILEKSVKRANAAIINIAQEYTACQGMGTTFVGGAFTNNTIVVAHVGDSRMYRLRDGDLLQLTEDHSLLQEKINAGKITKAEAKYAKDAHLVTRALGVNSEVTLALNEYTTAVGDYYLLCSDGLTDLVDDNEIKSTLLQAGGDLELAAHRLVALANACGGHDNVSVLIASVNAAFDAAGA